MKRSHAALPIFTLAAAVLVTACGARAGASGGDGERIVVLASAGSRSACNW